MGRRVTPTAFDPINGPNLNVLKMSEADLMENTRQLATLTGWLHYHTRSSRGSDPGFPDWIALRFPRILVIEFKSDTGKTDPDQDAWLDQWRIFAGALGQATWDTAAMAIDIKVDIWRPGDWLTRKIHATLDPPRR